MHANSLLNRQLHHDDLVIGARVTLGSKVVTKEEIIAFARAFDPQPIHIDEEAAKASMVGGLCASGFHSCAILMRLLVDGMLADATSLGSPGVDEVRWLKPVRPGDRVSARYMCTDKRHLASRPGVGISKIVFEMLNQAGDVVMIWDSNQFFKVRSPEPVPLLRDGSASETRNKTADPEPLGCGGRAGTIA